MKILMIGSLASHRNGLKLRKTFVDHDYIASPDAVGTLLSLYGSKNVTTIDDSHIFSIPDENSIIKNVLEIEVAIPGSTSEALLEKYDEDLQVATLNDLYLLKMSHRYKKNSHHFLKTMHDIHAMRAAGAVIEDPKLLKKRQKETLNYNHPKLNGVSSQKFFADSHIQYAYEHDDIHVAIARGERPAYTYYMQGDQEVNCSKDAFFSCSEELRLLGVYEEACVLSLERSIIPFKIEGDENRKKSFLFALEKVCTSITSGWFREFAWENYKKVVDLYDVEYVDRFYKAVDNGQVRLYNSGE